VPRGPAGPDLRERPIDAEGFDDLGLVAGGLDALISRSGSEAPHRLVIRVTCFSDSTGMMPGTMAADACCAASFHEAVIGLVVEEQLVVMNDAPASTLRLRFTRSASNEGARGVSQDSGHTETEIGVQALEQGDDITAEAQVILERTRHGKPLGRSPRSAMMLRMPARNGLRDGGKLPLECG